MAICSVCHRKASLNRYKLADGWICNKCFKECGFNLSTPITGMTTQNIISLLNGQKSNSDLIKELHITKKVGNLLAFDENKEKWWIITKKNIVPKIHDFAEIIDFELLEDGGSIAKGGLGRAAVGGALFGGVGAIVGAATGSKKSKQTCKSLQIKITLNNLNFPVEYINFINIETKKDGILYKTMFPLAQECLSTLQIVLDKTKQHKETENSVEINSIPDEILKYKQLLDVGAITQEEFDAKKKQLLGL